MRLLRGVPKLNVVELFRTWNANADAHHRPVRAKNSEEISAAGGAENVNFLSLEKTVGIFPSLSSSQFSSSGGSVIQLAGT